VNLQAFSFSVLTGRDDGRMEGKRPRLYVVSRNDNPHKTEEEKKKSRLNNPLLIKLIAVKLKKRLRKRLLERKRALMRERAKERDELDS
jgi:hypothetical protein